MLIADEDMHSAEGEINEEQEESDELGHDDSIAASGSGDEGESAEGGNKEQSAHKKDVSTHKHGFFFGVKNTCT